MHESAVRNELLNIKDVSLVLGVSLASVRRLDQSGKIPAPARLGKSVRWNRSELTSWIESGSPCRADWAAIKDAATRRARR